MLPFCARLKGPITPGVPPSDPQSVAPECSSRRGCGSGGKVARGAAERQLSAASIAHSVNKRDGSGVPGLLAGKP